MNNTFVTIQPRPINDTDLTDKVILLKHDSLLVKYRTLPNMLLRVTGGFGCSPVARGSAVFTDSIIGPKCQERWERSHIEGWYTDEEADQVIAAEATYQLK